jgi:hypothetical protein
MHRRRRHGIRIPGLPARIGGLEAPTASYCGIASEVSGSLGAVRPIGMLLLMMAANSGAPAGPSSETILLML